MKLNQKKSEHKIPWFGIHKDKQFGVYFFNNSRFPVLDKECTKKMMQMCFCPLFSCFLINANILLSQDVRTK